VRSVGAFGVAATGALVAVVAGGCRLDTDYDGTTFRCLERPTCPEGFRCVAGACLPADAYRDAVLEDAPIAYWRLGETAGPRAEDLVGTHLGTWQGGPALGVPGLLAQSDDLAAEVDGVDDELTAAVPIGDRVTIELLVGVDVIPADVVGLFTAEEYQTNGFRVGLSGGGIVDVWSTESGATGSVETAEGTILPGDVHHLVVTIAPDTATIYLDGEVAATGPFPWHVPDQPVSIGATNNANFFRGTLDEVAVYDTLLGAARIRAHADAAR
jgi:hypothetical protein